MSRKSKASRKTTDEKKTEGIICLWCEKGKLSVSHIPGVYDGQTGVEGVSFNEITCNKCGVEIRVNGSESSQKRALAPFVKLAKLQELQEKLDAFIEEYGQACKRLLGK